MPRKSRKNVGVIGLGIIGSRVVAALRANGFHVYVWNRSPRVMPNFLASPAEVAEVCETIQLFVSDAQALFEVIDSFGDHLTARHLIICSATVGPEATVEAARAVEERGAAFLDSPFTGSKAAADKRELVYYVGGTDECFEKAEPVLRASSKARIRIGKVGDAATVKIATNMLAAVSVQTLAEAVAVVKRSGIPPAVLIDAIENHATRSGLIDQKLPKMLKADFDPHFSLKHMFKDVQLAIHMANSLDIDIPATTATAGVMYGGLNRGWADLDFSALVKIYGLEEEEEDVTPEEEKEENEEKQTDGEAPAAQPSQPAPSAPVEATKLIEDRQPEKKTEPAPPPPEKVEPAPPKETLTKIAPPPPPPREELAASLAEKKLPHQENAQKSAASPPERAPVEKSEPVTELANNTAAPAAATASQTAAPVEPAPNTGAGPIPVAEKTAPPLNRIRRWFARPPSPR